MTWEEASKATLEEVMGAGVMTELKDYLRVDGDDDDAIVYWAAMAARQYIIDAVGEFDEANSSAKMLFYALTQEFYDNRTLMQSDIQQRLRQRYSYQSVILQLQMAKELKDGET